MLVVTSWGTFCWMSRTVQRDGSYSESDSCTGSPLVGAPLEWHRIDVETMSYLYGDCIQSWKKSLLRKVVGFNQVKVKIYLVSFFDKSKLVVSIQSEIVMLLT